MVLLGQLLHHQGVQGDCLLGHDAGLIEPFRGEHDLRNHGQVRSHHRHWSHQRFQVVGQLRTTRVTRIHGDKDTAIGVAGNIGAHKLKRGNFRLQRIQNGQDLHGHHGDHFNFNSIEFIEATPGARLYQARENTPHRLVVHTVGAIDHHNVFRKVLPQIFDSFSLAGSGRSQRIASSIEVHGSDERQHTTISQWGDHEPTVVPLVLIGVLQYRVGLTHFALAKFSSVFDVHEAQLRQPFKVRDGAAVGFHHAFNNVSIVDLHRDQCDDFVTLYLGKWTANHRSHLIQVGDLLLLLRLQSSLCPCRYCH
mmetsp:Transcript_174/g.336  ORF Transcript_174/g.336 Transcript_174/m.336 type:complete len:308 (-) Transcript_174:126-1049(-)